MQTLQLIQGTQAVYQIALLDANGDPITSYTASDSLSAEVWPGDDQSTIFTPSVEWIDATAGTLKLSFATADTSSIDPGKYKAVVYITVAGQDPVAAWYGLVDILAAPGSATLPKTYGSYEDMLVYALWIKDLPNADFATGFVENRAEARRWLDTVIQRHYRSFFGVPKSDGTAYYAYPMLNIGQDKVLKDWLDADYLMLTDQVREVVAKRAIGSVLTQLYGPTQEGSAYQQEGRKFLAEADSLVKSMVAQLDLNNDGFGDVMIDLRVASTRY